MSKSNHFCGHSDPSLAGVLAAVKAAASEVFENVHPIPAAMNRPAEFHSHDHDPWLSELREYLNIANDDDELLVEVLFKGSSSALLPEGALHPIERNLWHFKQYLAGRFCPEGLA